MKHKLYEMIVAKAENMELVVFISQEGSNWEECVINVNCIPSFEPDFNYFLCLPQHKEVCLHWLNGGEAEENYNNRWDVVERHSWHEQSVFMFDDGFTIRIKPNKEKRFVLIHHGELVSELFERDSDIRSSYGVEYSDLQIFEIEVEV